MTCQTCGNSNNDDSRAIWREYRSTIDDIENVAEAKFKLRSFFSPEDDWTETDEKICHSLDRLDRVMGRLVDLAAKYKAEHKIAVDLYQKQIEAEATAAEAINEAKAAESAE